MTTRTFTRDQLDEIGVPPDSPDDIEYSDTVLADEHVTTLKYTQLRRVVFLAEDDGLTYSVEYQAPIDTGDWEVGEAPDGHGWYGDTVDATEVEERPVVTQQWLPVDTPASPTLDTVLPAWEAMYEPGNVSDYLIGYTNSECAAKAAAEAWLRSQKEEVGSLEWAPQTPLDGYDTELELIERHDDGIDTGPGITVRRRTTAPAA